MEKSSPRALFPWTTKPLWYLVDASEARSSEQNESSNMSTHIHPDRIETIVRQVRHALSQPRGSWPETRQAWIDAQNLLPSRYDATNLASLLTPHVGMAGATYAAKQITGA